MGPRTEAKEEQLFRNQETNLMSEREEREGAKAEPMMSAHDDEAPMHSAVSLPSAKLPDVIYANMTDRTVSLEDAKANSEYEDGPIYSAITPTGKTPLSTGAALKVPNEDEQGYSPISLIAPPPAKKLVKFKAKSAFNMKPPPFKASPNPQEGASMAVEEDNLYSTVSNIPKKIGSQNKRAVTYNNSVSLAV